MYSAPVSLIRAARLKKGLTQAALGERVGVGKSAVSAWERDVEVPDTRRLARLNRALKPHLRLEKYLAHVERLR